MMPVTLPESAAAVITPCVALPCGIYGIVSTGKKEQTMSQDHEEPHEKLVKTSVYLEEEVLEALGETARELEKDTARKWSKGGVIRLALSDFFTRRGKML
jgi:hypothetical protein